MCDEYNGWPNRETWATMLYIDNDQGLHEYVGWQAREALGADYPRAIMSDILRDYFDELAQDSIADEGMGASRTVRMMLHDIGSLYRVDWWEIAGHLLDVAAEDVTLAELEAGEAQS